MENINFTTSNGISLTKNEASFLAICLNYDNAEQQRSDNYSNGGIAEATRLFNHATTKLNRQAAGGLLSSLNSKNLGYLDDEFDSFYLSDIGIDAAIEAKAWIASL